MSGSDHSLVQLDRECDHIRGKRLRTGRFRKALCPSRREYPLENQLLRISQWACLGRPFGAVLRATGPVAKANAFPRTPL